MNEAFDEKIKRLSSINPTVKNYIDSEQFITSYLSIDSIQESSLLNKCYFLFMDDLKKIGIDFYDYADLLNNSYDAESIVWLYDIISPSKIISLLTDNEKVVSFINDYIDTISSNEFIIYFLDFLSTYYPDNDEYNNYFVLLHDKIHSTENFKDYILQLNTMHKAFNNSKEDIVINNPNQLNDFFEYYKKSKEDAITYLNKLKEFKLDVDKIKLYFFNTFLKDILINTDKLTVFSLYYSVMINDNKYLFREQLKKQYKIYYSKYINQSMTHPFFFKNTQTSISLNNIAIMAIGTFLEEQISPFKLDDTIRRISNELYSINPELSKQYTSFIKVLKS